MRWVGLAVLLLAVPACAQPATDEGGLWLTANGAIYPQVGGSGGDYVMASSPGDSPGLLAAAVSSGYYAPWSVTLTHTVETGFVYVDDGEVRVSLQCSLDTPVNPLGADVTVRFTYADSSFSLSGDLPGDCGPTPRTAVMELPTQGMRFEADEPVEVTVSVFLPNPSVRAESTNVWLVADDPAHPTGLFAPWAFAPDLTAFTWEEDWGQFTFAELDRFWSTDAAKVRLNLTGEIGAGQFELTILDAGSGDEVFHELVSNNQSDRDEPLDLLETLEAGNGTRWVVTLYRTANSGEFQLALEPLAANGTALSAPVKGPGGTGSGVVDEGIVEDGSGRKLADDEEKDAPGPGLAALLVAVAAVVLARRRR